MDGILRTISRKKFLTRKIYHLFLYSKLYKKYILSPVQIQEKNSLYK